MDAEGRKWDIAETRALLRTCDHNKKSRTACHSAASRLQQTFNDSHLFVTSCLLCTYRPVIGDRGQAGMHTSLYTRSMAALSSAEQVKNSQHV